MTDLANTISPNDQPAPFVLSKRRLAFMLGGGLLVSGLLAWFGNTWLATPFGFLFGVWLPGVLLYLLIKRQFTFDWMSSLLSIGLGMATLMATTLSVNWLLKAFGMAMPLQRGNVFLAILLVSAFFLIAGVRRWHGQPFTFHKPRLNIFDAVTIAASVLLLLAVIVGTIQLNNGGPGTIALACFLSIPVLVTWLLVVRKRLNTGSIIFALWLMGLGVLLAGWLRGNYIAGPDVGKEFLVFQLTKQNGFWDIAAYRDAYNACLSVNILPTAFSFLTKMPDMLIFKLLIPAIYSLIIPIVFILARSRVKVAGAILATVFFFAQPPFSIWWWVPIRQQMALFFFALLLLILVKLRRNNTSGIFFVVLAASMIVSHYSTTYIALALLGVLILVHAFMSRNKKRTVPPLLIRPALLFAMLLSTFMWYSQITYGFENVSQFASKSVQNLGSMFSEDVQQSGQSMFDRFNIFSKPGTTATNAVDYALVKSQIAQEKSDPNQLYTTGTIPQLPSYQPASSASAGTVELLRNLFKVLGNLAVSAGIIVVGVLMWRKRSFDNHALLQISALAIMAIALSLPFFSVSYGPDRLYLQLLLIMAGAVAIYTTIPRMRKMVRRLVFAGTTAFVLGYFLLLNQVPLQFTQTPQRSLNFNNSGNQYYMYHISREDAEAARWLAHEKQAKLPIYGDSFSFYRLSADTNLQLMREYRTGVLIGSLPRNSYVYQTSENTATQAGFDRFGGGVITYQFPTDFLSEQKNTVYSNGEAVIYR